MFDTNLTTEFMPTITEGSENEVNTEIKQLKTIQQSINEKTNLDLIRTKSKSK